MSFASYIRLTVVWIRAESGHVYRIRYNPLLVYAALYSTTTSAGVYLIGGGGSPYCLLWWGRVKRKMKNPLRPTDKIEKIEKELLLDLL